MPCRSCIQVIIVVAFVFWTALATQPAAAGAAEIELAQSDNLLQCMEKCIREEGKDEKDTCKLRCAKIPSQGAQQKDCMGVYKQCKKNCPSATKKACRKQCKKQLTSCS